MSFKINIEKSAKENEFFRKVLYTGEHAQVVLMSISPGEDIGQETHEGVDQVLVFVQGKGEAIIEGVTEEVKEGDLSFVPAGALHNFRNTGQEPLKLYTVYSPAEHPDGTVYETKAEAEDAGH